MAELCELATDKSEFSVNNHDVFTLPQIYLVQKPQQVPESLKALLLSERVIKVGYHVQGNLDLLSMLWELITSRPKNKHERQAGLI
jgi:hypothetical protein